MLVFLSWVLPWFWLSLSALSGFLYWRKSWGALPLMWCFLALGVGDLVGTWMATHYVYNIWVDRLITLGVTGGLLGYIDDHIAPRWAILGLTFVGSCILSGTGGFGLLTPMVVFGLVAWATCQDLQGRVRGSVRGRIPCLVGCVGWAWLSVLRLFADPILKISTGAFLCYWSLMTFGVLGVLGLILWGCRANNPID